jgi:hypothetical protein
VGIGALFVQTPPWARTFPVLQKSEPPTTAAATQLKYLLACEGFMVFGWILRLACLNSFLRVFIIIFFLLVISGEFALSLGQPVSSRQRRARAGETNGLDEYSYNCFLFAVIPSCRKSLR